MENKFSTLGICGELTNILKKNNITLPTPVQQQAIPILLAKKDLIAQAQTGTGKTLAFLLPMMEQIQSSNPWVQGLIISPTRELALQITEEVTKLASLKNINVLATFGGQDVERQIRKLKGEVHIVIGTPGRLLDHMTRKSVDFSKVSMLVLDEADQIMDMGFFPDVEKIIHQTPQKRQTMLFSATITKGVRKMTSKFMKEPEQVIINSKNVTLDKIKQLVIQTSSFSKRDALCKFIDEENPFMAIIFCKTRQRASDLNIALGKLGYDTDELQGDMLQSKREKVMRKFRDLKLKLLVATDIAARGLDIEGVTHIINYDMPPDAESYIHRIGRTGRAGQAGFAVTFETHADREALQIIEEGIRFKIEKQKVTRGVSPIQKDAQTSEDGLAPKMRDSFPRNRSNSRHEFSRSGSNHNSNRGANRSSNQGDYNRGSKFRGNSSRNNSSLGGTSMRDNSSLGFSARRGADTNDSVRIDLASSTYTREKTSRSNSHLGGSSRSNTSRNNSPRRGSSSGDLARGSSNRGNSNRRNSPRGESTHSSISRDTTTRNATPRSDSSRSATTRSKFAHISSYRGNSTRTTYPHNTSTRSGFSRQTTNRGDSGGDSFSNNSNSSITPHKNKGGRVYNKTANKTSYGNKRPTGEKKFHK